MKGLVPARRPLRYVVMLTAGMLSQLTFTLMLALAFSTHQMFSEAFAIGGITLSMVQMTYIRAIHLPVGMVRLAMAFLGALWAIRSDLSQEIGYPSITLSLIALCSATYFISSVLRANNRLHVNIAKEREAALAADKAKSRFLAQMSHELRTPLNAILGLGHVELALTQDPASRERMQLVTGAAKGLAEILDDILDMSAIEAGRLAIHASPCDLAVEISAATSLFLPLFQAAGLSLKLSLGPNLPKRVLMDAQRLRQCMSNLLSNALKHTVTGGVSVVADVDAAGRLALVVADTGPGIAPAEAEGLFQPFHRGAGDKPGNGLGLSITRALARSMGGDLTLLGATNGARFLLTLAVDIAPDEIPVLTGVPGADGPELRGLKVLVVDDIATNRLVAKAHLGLLGMTTTEAASGEAALAQILKDPPDLVLLDMNMPGMDGIATLKRIRTLPSRAARLPVIAMTADATEAHRRHYLAAGLDDYLAKPLTPETLTTVLQRSLLAAALGRKCTAAR